MDEFDRFPKKIEPDPETGRVSGHIASDEVLEAHARNQREESRAAQRRQRSWMGENVIAVVV